MKTFRAAILGDYVQVARFVGLDPFAILRRAKISPDWLDDPDAPLELASVVQVLEESASLSGRDDFGVLLAETRVFSSLGPVSLLLEHEHSVRSVLQAAIEFRPLVNESLSIAIEDEGGTAFIHFQVPLAFGTPQFVSHVVAVAASVLVDASGGAWRPGCVHFSHTRPRWSATYARHFGCTLAFESTFDGISCESSHLDTQVPTAEPALANYARRLLNLCSQLSDHTVTHHVRNSIQLLLREGTPTLGRVGANLARSPRVIQRLLRAEGQTFEGQLNAVRTELAIRYLTQSTLDLTQVAYNLGFASLPSFSRWFATRFGMPPSKWRTLRLRDTLERAS